MLVTELLWEIILSIFLAAKRWRRLRRLEFADLPKTISGKIRRGAVAGAEAERAQTAQRHLEELQERGFS
jgi:acyl-coenzyme A synthetase/AMP-(fatty) acid ligase